MSYNTDTLVILSHCEEIFVLGLNSNADIVSQPHVAVGAWVPVPDLRLSDLVLLRKRPTRVTIGHLVPFLASAESARLGWLWMVFLAAGRGRVLGRLSRVGLCAWEALVHFTPAGQRVI